MTKINRLILIFALAFTFSGCTPSVSAQSGFTNVTAQVLDPTGNAYTNCSYNVDFVGQATGSSQPYTVGGTSPFQQSFGGAKCDSSGNLAIRIADNLQITPTPSQWQFSICDSTGTACFATLITITGLNQNVTAQIQSAAIPINPPINPSGPNINNIRYANAFSGVDAAEKIHNCLIDLPATGGTCDARGIEGNQSMSTNPFVGILKPFELWLGHAKFAAAACWLFANDGAPVPRQSAIHIRGVGIDAGSTGNPVPATGTIVDNSCNGGSVAKIVSLGVGVLEIEGITFQDSSGGSLPFYFSTNTIPKIHDNQWYGSKNGTANNQDVLILGGTSDVIDGSVNSPFQGYGGYITHNFFDHIRRAIWGQNFFNSFPVTENTVWLHSGSNLVGGAAIQITSGATQAAAGSQIRDNLIEVVNYPYAIKLDKTGDNNILTGNGCFDPTITHLSCLRFENNSSFNYIVEGYRNDTYPGITEDISSLGTNEYHTSHQSQVSVLPQLYKFTAGSGLTMAFNATGARAFNNKLTTTNDEIFWQLFNSAGLTYDLSFSPAGGAAEQIFQFRRLSGIQSEFKINASDTAYFRGLGNARFLAAGGFAAFLGTDNKPNALTVTDGIVTINHPLAINGDDIAANTLALKPPVGAGANTFSVLDSSGNPIFDIGGTGNVSISAAANHDLQFTNQAAKGFRFTVNGATDTLFLNGSGGALFTGGVQLNTSTGKPACASGIRGTFWVTAGGAGVKDNVEVCAKDAADAYAWRTIY